MTREEILKESIKSQYGSVLKFANTIGIPESSIRNIFTRGIDSVNAGALVTICKALNLDIESLVSGTFSLKPNAQKDAVYTNYVTTLNMVEKPQLEAPSAKVSGPGAVSDAEAALQQRFLALMRQLTPSEQDVVFAFIQNLLTLREHPPSPKLDH